MTVLNTNTMELTGTYTSEEILQNNVLIDHALGPNKFNFRSDLVDTRAKALSAFPNAPIGSMITGPGMKFMRVANAGDETDFRRMSTRVHWDDLRFPSSGLNPPGPVQAPATNTETGLLEFADSATNLTAGIAQMPHAWNEGSEVQPHIHWLQASAGNVVWRLEYRLMPAVNGPFPAEWTTVTASTTTHAYPGSGTQVMITSFPVIDMTGYSLSAMILFRVARLGADVADTLVGAVQMLEFDIHYQSDQPGSELTFVKYGD